MLLVQLERLHQLHPGVGLAIRLADQLDGLVQGVEDDAEAFQDVDAPLELFQFVLEAALDRLEAEIEEVPQDRLEAQPLWLQLAVGGRHQTGHVVGEALLEGGVFVEVRHHHLRVGVGLDIQGDAQPVFGVGFVGQPGQLRQLARVDDLADAVLQVALVDAVGDRGDDDLAALAHLFQLPFRLHLDAAGALLVDFAEGGTVGDDLAAQREIWPLHLVQQHLKVSNHILG